MRAILLAALLVACSSPTLAPRDCTPGTTSACVCAAAQASGVQVCTADGTLGACVCADAGTVLPDAGASAEDRPAGIDAVTMSRPDVWMGTDPVPLEDRPDVSPATGSDVLTGGDVACSEPGRPILRRCGSDSDCAACAPGVSGLTWCCRGTGYCENTRACESDAGRYAPDVRVECAGLIRCRVSADCERLCLPRSSGVWCCTQGGECTTRELPTCNG